MVKNVYQVLKYLNDTYNFSVEDEGRPGCATTSLTNENI
jgi:hypothetical protein